VAHSGRRESQCRGSGKGLGSEREQELEGTKSVPETGQMNSNAKPESMFTGSEGGQRNCAAEAGR
jgi:hypothetical protein